MNLIELYDQLEVPEGSNDKLLRAIRLPNYPQFRVATDIEGNPILLFRVLSTGTRGTPKNIHLKYVSLAHDIECKVIENGKTTLGTFTIITFTSSDRGLREYFLRVSESLLKSLSVKPTDQQITEALFRFVEIFQALSSTPTSTIQGLWAELFLISISRKPSVFIDFWHRVPEEKFDFNAGDERVEVKSSSTMDRVHSFSAEQLCPPQGVQVLIASILLKQTNDGKSIQDLTQSVAARVDTHLELIDKLYSIVFRTLGSSLTTSAPIKYDLTVAQNSLRFYRHQDIHKITSEHIPTAVSEVKYKSNLSNVAQVQITDFGTASGLFKNF
jgi:hypothetical protein